MVTKWRRRWAARRVKPGDGRPLKRFRWWQMFLGRALLHLEPAAGAGRPAAYSVDVRHMGSAETGEVVAHLYRDGRHHAASRVPAVFPVEGGVIEVATSAFGVKRAHLVTDGGGERPLIPDPRSAEGRRARLERERPGRRGERRRLRLADRAAAVAQRRARPRGRAGQHRARVAAAPPLAARRGRELTVTPPDAADRAP